MSIKMLNIDKKLIASLVNKRYTRRSINTHFNMFPTVFFALSMWIYLLEARGHHYWKTPFDNKSTFVGGNEPSHQPDRFHRPFESCYSYDEARRENASGRMHTLGIDSP